MKAMTPSGTALLALRLVCEAPLPLPDTGSRITDVALLTQQMNDCLERGIHDRLASWLGQAALQKRVDRTRQPA